MSDIIITNLSKLNPKAEKMEYKSDKGIFEGIQTNEAPVMYLLEYLKDGNKTAGKIIAVATEEADSAFDNLKTVVEKYCADNGMTAPCVEKVRYTSSAETIKNIIALTNEKDSIYADSTGGFRDTVITMLMAFRVLEFSGVELKKAVYSNNNSYEITDMTDTYKLYNLIGGVNSFTSYGNSDELEKYFEKSSNEIIKSAVKAMKKFSDNITLCRTKNINEDMKELNDALSKLTKLTIEAPETVLFGALAELIKQKFYISEKNNKIELPGIVKWCADNKLIQQAVTIYVERMPEYFYDKEFYSVADDVLNECVNSKSNFDWHYDLFYNKFMRLESPKAAKVKLLPIEDIINNDLENDFITKKALIESKSVEAFKFKAKQISKIMPKGSETEKAMNEFFKLKNTIFLGGKRKSVAELNEAKHKESRFAQAIDALDANTVEGFIKQIINHGKVKRMLCGLDEEPEGNKQSDGLALRSDIIENLGEYTQDNNRYKINIPVPDMKKVMTDYIYIKNFFRNKMNHASIDDDVDTVLTDYLTQKNYNTSDNISVEDIQNIMKGIIDHIENIKA